MNTTAIAKNILDINGIVGIGSSPTIKVFVSSPKYAEAIPKKIAGKPVKVYVTGNVYPLSRTGYVRPLIGGISVGDIDITAGTLGVVHNGYMLSNAHVLAMDELGNFVNPGIEIIQPGKYDGGMQYDKIGYLKGYGYIDFNSTTADNYVDLAIGKVVVDYENDKILGIDKFSFEPVEVKEGDVVIKSGRTTGVTKGKVISESASVKVNYAPNKWAVFHDVFVVQGDFSRGGDSGSIVIKDGKFAGLLFSGNPQHGYTFVCKAKHVISVMNKIIGGESVVRSGNRMVYAGIAAIGLYLLWRHITK